MVPCGGGGAALHDRTAGGAGGRSRGVFRPALLRRRGPRATVSLRANYLAAPKFSGGGRAAFSLDLGLDLDVRLAGRLHGVVDYTFERVNRKTDPGGTGEIAAPIQQTLARVGLGIGF